MTTMELQKVNQQELQLIRMQQQVKEIAKETNKEVIGIEQLNEEEWVIVSKTSDQQTLQLMINHCGSPYRGKWDFAIQAEYTSDHALFIDDIKGEPCQGFGSICMAYLKETAWAENCIIKGDLVKRDWDHLDRLTHFYKKHSFSVEINEEQQVGRVHWNG